MLIVRRGALPACAAFVLTGLLLPGCGGGPSARGTRNAPGPISTHTGSTSASHGVTAAEKRFVALAEPICRRTNAQLARLTVRKRTPRFAAALIRNEGVERRATGELAELAPPLALAAAWQAMLGYRRSLANQLGALAAAAERKAHLSEEAIFNSKKQLHQQLREAADKAGFKDCAQVG